MAIVAGRDLTLAGAQVYGSTVNALVGRDLTIASDQDTARQSASQSSWSAGASLGLSAALTIG